MSPTQHIPATMKTTMETSYTPSFDQNANTTQTQLPSYDDAVASRKPGNYTILVSEKKQPFSDVATKPRTRLQTFKSIILGDVYQHHPLRSMERNIDTRLENKQSTASANIKQPVASGDIKPRKRYQTFKAIIRGDVYEHHLRSMERTFDVRATR